VEITNKEIRIRVCLVVLQDNKILLVPHYNTDRGPVQWNLPGGKIEFGENIKNAAVREFEEEIGLIVEIIELLDVSEVIIKERPWHSITITYLGAIKSGRLKKEQHRYGEKYPKWFERSDLSTIEYHPKEVVDKTFTRVKKT
jgi:ADP-ribose pyrophosphatase YjhB (NUDIX family)